MTRAERELWLLKLYLRQLLGLWNGTRYGAAVDTCLRLAREMARKCSPRPRAKKEKRRG